MVTYDPKIVSEYVDFLYSKTKSTILISICQRGLIGLIVGAAAGVIFRQAINAQPLKNMMFPLWLFLGILIGAMVGYKHGKMLAFRLKATAQIMLSLVKIEESTRKNCNLQ